MSKGSSPRPFSVSQAEFADRFDTIFGKKNKAKDIDDSTLNVYNDERLVSKFDKMVVMANEYYDLETKETDERTLDGKVQAPDSQ